MEEELGRERGTDGRGNDRWVEGGRKEGTLDRGMEVGRRKERGR